MKKKIIAFAAVTVLLAAMFPIMAMAGDITIVSASPSSPTIPAGSTVTITFMCNGSVIQAGQTLVFENYNKDLIQITQTGFAAGNAAFTVDVKALAGGETELGVVIMQGTVRKTSKYITINVPVKEYHVKFDTAGGTPETIKLQVVKEGEKVVRPADPVKAGYKFDGWFLELGDMGVRYDFNDSVASDLKLFATWEKVEDTVPSTGDNSNLLLYAVVSVLALAAMSGLVIRRKTQR